MINWLVGQSFRCKIEGRNDVKKFDLQILMPRMLCGIRGWNSFSQLIYRRCTHQLVFQFIHQSPFIIQLKPHYFTGRHSIFAENEIKELTSIFVVLTLLFSWLQNKNTQFEIIYKNNRCTNEFIIRTLCKFLSID